VFQLVGYTASCADAIGGTTPGLMARPNSGHCSDANICQLWSLERARAAAKAEINAEARST
jgi:hypothetical protein